MKLVPHKTGSVGLEDRGYEFWCPGCGRTHYVVTWASSRTRQSELARPVHTFNNDLDSPTFRPAIEHFRKSGEWIDDGAGQRIWTPTAIRRVCCNVRVIHGMLRYTQRSEHHLAGHTVPMQDVPDTRERRADAVSWTRQRNAIWAKQQAESSRTGQA